MSVKKNSLLVQSALLGWLWELPAAKELRLSYGAMALWPYGAKV